MSRILHRLLVVSCLLSKAAQAGLAPSNTAVLPQTSKAGIGIVEALEKENLIGVPSAIVKDGKAGAAASPAIGVVKAEKALPQTTKADTPPNPDSTKASEKSDSTKNSTKAEDAKSTSGKKDDKPMNNVARPVANKTAASSISSTNATKAAAGAGPATAATNGTHAAVQRPAVSIHDLTFWEILTVWTSELLNCIPIVLIAYSVLCLAVHYPSLVDRVAHWYMVRTTTMQTGVLSGKNMKTLYMGRGIPGYGSELDYKLESGKYATFSTPLNHFSSSNQFEL